MEHMSKLRIALLLVSFLCLAALAQDTEPKEITEVSAVCALKVEGMTCEGCVAGVEQALLNIPGVKKATVDLKTHSAVVEYDDEKTNQEKILCAKLPPGQSIALKKHIKERETN